MNLMSFVRLLPIFPVVICTITAIYGTINLYQHRHSMFIKKRYIPFGLNITMILGMVFASCVYIAAISDHASALTIGITLFFASWYCIFLLLNIKNWMIYFKYYWTYYTLELQWQKIINPTIVEHEHNWYIHNNTKYGNISYIYKLFGICHFISFCISVYLMYARAQRTHQHTISWIFGLVLLFMLLTPVLMYTVIVVKTPSVNDTFSINWESKMHAKISVILIIGYVLTNLAKSIVDNHLTATTITMLTVPYALFLMVYASTFRIIHRNNETKNVPLNLNHAVSSSNVQLDLILSHKEALHLFVVNLSNEYSLECLLAFLEFTQFQQYILSKAETLGTNSEIKLIDFPENIPMSEIIEFDDNKLTLIENIKLKAHKLYNKYCLPGCEYEINVSAFLRKPLTDAFSDKKFLMDSNMNLNGLLMAFDRAKQEMRHLMRQSLTRFRYKTEYEEVDAIFLKGNEIIQAIDSTEAHISLQMTNTASDVPMITNRPSLKNAISDTLLQAEASNK